jgi:outer membrane protein OmpA-like peptidoglycan-associated protein
MVGKHEGGIISHRVRRIVVPVGLVLLTGLAGFGAISLVPSDETPQIVVSSPVEASEGPGPQEHHIAAAMATPAGQLAADASQRVTRDREAAANDPATHSVQSRLDQATGGPLMFDADTATLTPESAEKVERVVNVLRDNPGTRIEIVGHTAVEIADPPLCLQLSQLRAEQVLSRLQIAGIAPDRLHAIGISHTQPKDTAYQSRRVELLVLSDAR